MLSLLSQLIQKSLVESEPGAGGENPEGRYFFLEVMRLYAAEKLTESGEGAAVRERHLKWCVSLAKQAEAHFDGPEQKKWLDRLERDHDNFRSALDHTPKSREAKEDALNLAGILRFFWCKRGYFTEARERLARVLQRKPPARSPALAKALSAAGYLAECQGDYAEARELGRQAMQLREQLGDVAGAAQSRMNVALVDMAAGDYTTATAEFQTSLEIFRGMDHKVGQARALGNLGQIAYLEGKLPRAVELQEQAKDLAEQAQDYGRVALAECRLGMAEIELQRYGPAREHLTDALDRMYRLGDKWGTLVCLEGLAVLAADEGDGTRACRLLGAAHTLRVAIGTPRPRAEQVRYDRAVSCAAPAAPTRRSPSRTTRARP